MRSRKWLAKTLAALVAASVSANAAALGEFNGVWFGQDTVSVAAQIISAPSGTIVYQPDADKLHLFTAFDDRVLTLTRSGNSWVLPSPRTVTLVGIPLTLETFTLQFPGLHRSTSNFTASTQGVQVSGTSDHRRHPCAGIRAPYRSSPFSGAEGSLRCFEVIVPAGATALRASTRGGSGDVDLIAAYHKPDFRNATSELNGNVESVVLNSPKPGKWFVGVVGWTNFAGVTLSVTIDVPIVLVPSFTAKPTSGVAPLTVQFTDSSNGVVNEWFWQFGDGRTSTERNPKHVYKAPGHYDVRLRVTGPGGTKSLTKPDAVRVNDATTLTPILDLLFKKAREAQ